MAQEPTTLETIADELDAKADKLMQKPRFPRGTSDAQRLAETAALRASAATYGLAARMLRPPPAPTTEGEG